MVHRKGSYVYETNDHLTQSMQIRTTWENILPTRLENIKKFDEHVVTLRTW